VEEHRYVFTTLTGTAIEPGNLRRAWVPLRDAAGLGEEVFHGIRHTCVTLLQIGSVAFDATFDSFCDCAVAARFAPAQSAGALSVQPPDLL